MGPSAPADRLLRTTLWLTAPLNLLVAYSFAIPDGALGELLQLPQGGDAFYRLLAATLVGLFGLVYLWLALQPQPDRALVLVGASGKTLAALCAIALYFADSLAGVPALFMSGDLLLAGIWFYWLARQVPQHPRG
ncbi:MAG: hypothetical protein R3228_08350 [Halioglobus sp.]|nr:hypothetical protein [Halioglobus sp.]